MPRHPIDGVKGSKPRVEKDDKVSKAELSRLNREYLHARNSQMRAKASLAEMEAAKRRGELISRNLVVLQAAYLLTAFRQRVLSEPRVLISRLLRERLLEEKHQHAVQELITSDLCAMLNDLSQLPSQVVDENNIDEDLAAQVEGISEFRQTPFQAKAAAEKARVRREQKGCDDAQASHARTRQELGSGVTVDPSGFARVL
jgi:hypothetical protein